MLTEIASDAIGARLVTETEARFRIDGTIERMERPYLVGRLRHVLKFGREGWPKAIICPGITHPIIFHPGLLYKFTERKDPDHVRFAYYGPAVIKQPVEVWKLRDEGRWKYHILGTLSVGNTLHHMIVVVEADSHICDTAYVVARPERIETYRYGDLVLASWKLGVE